MLKGALNAVTRALAIEYAKDGIRVNTVAPGVIKLRCTNLRPTISERVAPGCRIGEVKEIVDAVLFLDGCDVHLGEILPRGWRRARG